MKISWLEYFSPIRDQKTCGSCVAFGSIRVFEGKIRIKETDKNAYFPLRSVKGYWTPQADFSEQDLFACSGGTCDRGNTMEPVLDRMRVGVATEECCPYEARDVRCGSTRCVNWHETARKIESWRRITDFEEMKKMLDEGPLIGVMAVHQSFLAYKSGVYHSLGLMDPVVGYHCLAVGGYDDDRQALILSNSWGSEWGGDPEEGCCYIKYHDSETTDEMFLISPSDEPVDPTEPECPVSRFILKVFGASVLNVLRKIRYSLFGI